MKKKLSVILPVLLVLILVSALLLSGCSLGGNKTDTTTAKPTLATLDTRVTALEGNIPNYALKSELNDFVSFDDLNSALDNISSPDLSNYATDAEVSTALDNFVSSLTAEQIAALKTKLGLSTSSGGGSTVTTTRWLFDSLFLDSGTFYVDTNDNGIFATDEKVTDDAGIRDMGRRSDTDGLYWDYSSSPSKIEDSDFYEITLYLYNSTSHSIKLTNVWIEFTLTPKEYCQVNQDTTYLDSDKSPFLSWDSAFKVVTREGVKVCRQITFTSDDYIAVVPKNDGTTDGSVILKLVLELNY